MNFEERLQKAEGILDYRFLNRQYLVQALMHRSLSEYLGLGFHYERMEFLGDSLLGRFVSEKLYRESGAEPGILTQQRAALVSGKALKKIALELNLDDCVLVMPHLRLNSGELSGNFISDIVESLLAAVWLDGGEAGFEKVAGRILNFCGPTDLPLQDSKSRLQEICLKATKLLPVYASISEDGRYVVQVSCDGLGLASGVGLSKKEAEQMAASSLIQKLEVKGS